MILITKINKKNIFAGSTFLNSFSSFRQRKSKHLFFKNATSKKLFFKKFGNGIYNSALIGMSLSSPFSNLLDFLNPFNSEQDQKNFNSTSSNLNNSSFGNGFPNYKRNSFYGTSLRPSIRFASHAYKSSVNFGLPWIY